MASILIIDDRVPRRGFLSLVLEQHGHTVCEADDDEQAARLAAETRPDLVLIHVLMPYPNGNTRVRPLNAAFDPPLNRMIFFAAPCMAEEARQLAAACGVTRVITDISDTHALLASITAALTEAPAAPGVPAESPVQAPLYRLARHLYARLEALETANARLAFCAALDTARLVNARSALDEEIGKRLRTEADMNHEYRRLHARSVRDPLTGLYNRRYLEESLAREESRASRNGEPLGLMMIDIDHFKRCNDTHGHAAGDAVLRAVSQCMEALSRSGDILCRYGGEEFVLLMSNTTPDALQQRAEALRIGVAALDIHFGERRIGPVTLSIGLAGFPEHGASADAALHAADAALYRAKTSGRNRVETASWAVNITHH